MSSLYNITNLDKVLDGRTDKLILKEVYGRRTKKIYINIDDDNFIYNPMDYIEERVRNYEEEAGIEVLSYINNYDNELDEDY